MKNRGFTLIELLAIIIILAVIATLTIPVVINIIERTEKDGEEISADLYIDTVRKAIAAYQVKENKMPKTGKDIQKYLEFKGSKLTYSELVIYENGEIYIDNLKSEDTLLLRKYGKKQYNGENQGKEVYFDVKNGVPCKKESYRADNSITGYNGINPNENQTSCLKFYAYDYGGERISLLLDHNTTGAIPWSTSDDGMVFKKLKEDTKDWKVQTTFEDKTNYYYDYSSSESKYIEKSYQIKYSNSNARLITAQEIADITGKSKKDALNWDEEQLYQEDFEFIEEKYKWLESSYESGVTHGYWTSTVYYYSMMSSLSEAWNVSGNNLTTTCTWYGPTNYNAPAYNGVRPVIEVLRETYNF